MMNTTYNFADKLTRVKVPAIPLNNDIIMDQIGSRSSPHKDIMAGMRARSQERTESQVYSAGKDDQEHVFIVNEEGMRGKTPGPKGGFSNYDQTFYDPNMSVNQTFMRQDNASIEASSKGQTFHTS